MNLRLPAAAFGFAFVAAWIGFGFGEALLCLLGAAVFWLLAATVDGNVDLGALQARLRREQEPLSGAGPGRVRRAGGPRVQ